MAMWPSYERPAPGAAARGHTTDRQLVPGASLAARPARPAASRGRAVSPPRCDRSRRPRSDRRAQAHRARGAAAASARPAAFTRRGPLCRAGRVRRDSRPGRAERPVRAPRSAIRASSPSEPWHVRAVARRRRGAELGAATSLPRCPRWCRSPRPVHSRRWRGCRSTRAPHSRACARRGPCWRPPHRFQGLRR